MEAFTNTSWQGGVFLRADFTTAWFLLERLVHESSHLRLNVIMACEKVHYANPEERVPSPFRAGPRPVNGLYHGAFVFTRSAEVLARLYESTRDQAVAHRIRELRLKVQASFEIIDRYVLLTPFGRTLLDDIYKAFKSTDV
jgi:HEXXH motif-containing protein